MHAVDKRRPDLTPQDLQPKYSRMTAHDTSVQQLQTLPIITAVQLPRFTTAGAICRQGCDQAGKTLGEHADIGRHNAAACSFTQQQ